jgi:peptidoglycan/LPS O-acetylase OafA/YrhL
MNNIYFPSLNGIRFFAALLVIIDHLELFKGYFGIRMNWSKSFSSHLGSSGVTIFFVLSGFLITFLLLKEKETKAINVKHFYIRRILRIWPIYYLILIVSFFIIPQIDFFNVPEYGDKSESFLFSTFFTYLFLLANVGYVYFPPIAFANVLWSVAVEEQFYLIWPIIIKYFKSTMAVFIFIFITYLVIKLLSSVSYFTVKSYLPDKFYYLVDRTRISSMVIGGIGAFLIINFRSFVDKYIFSKSIQTISILSFTFMLFNIISSQYYSFIKNECLSLFVIIIILNTSSNTNSILNLENKILNYLGKISYGIYVYHLFACVLCIKLFSYYNLNEILPNAVYSTFMFISVLFITIIISHISYKYFEKFFLIKKIKYS